MQPVSCLYARQLARCFPFFAGILVCAAFFLSSRAAFAQTVSQTGVQDWVEVQISAPPDGVPDYWLEAYFLPSNPRYGWIVGFYRRTLFTTDSGRTWTRSQIPGRLSYNRNDFRNHLEGVSFPDSLVGYASGPGGVFKSTDGGRSWSDITPLSLRGIESRTWGCYFTHRDTGYVMSGGCGDQQLFLRTTNGGATWTVFSGPENNAGLTDAIVFSSRGLGYAVASGRIFRTLNGGLSWDIFADSYPPNSPVRNAWQEDLAISGNTFLVPYSGTECPGAGAGGGMRTSTDGGRSWSQFPTGAQMYGVFLVNDSVGWAAGVNGAAYFTEDYGRTWRLRNCGIPPGKDLDDLWFVNDTLGFIVGEGVYRYVPPTERELKIRQVPQSPFYCEGDSLELRVSGGFAQYRWSNGATTASVVVRESGTYVVTATVFDCVRLSDTIRVTFLRRPSAKITLSTPPRVCAGTTVRLTSDLQTSDFSYEWTDGRSVLSRSPNLDVTQSGVYTLLVRNGGCVASSSTTVTVIPRPNTDIVSLRQTRFCIGDSALLQAPAGFTRYRWSDGVNADIGAARELITRSSGAYSVELTDVNGCVWTSNTISLTALDFPKQLFVLSERLEIQMDTTGLNRLTCATITLQNTDAARTVAMSTIPVARNIEFSVPPSQLPFILPPGATRNLTVCFSPRDLGERRDTMYVEDSCGVTAIPLFGESISNNFAGDSRCRSRVILRTFSAQGLGGGLSAAEVLRLAEPSPNPASANLTLRLERHIEPFGDEPIWARCTLKDVLGVTVAEGTYAPETRFTEGAERYERGEFTLSVGHIPSGAYLLVVQSAHGAATFSVVINR